MRVDTVRRLLSSPRRTGREQRGSATEQLLDFACEGGHIFTSVELGRGADEPGFGAVAVTEAEGDEDVSQRITVGIDREVMLDRFPLAMVLGALPVVNDLLKELVKLSNDGANIGRGASPLSQNRYRKVNDGIVDSGVDISLRRHGTVTASGWRRSSRWRRR